MNKNILVFSIITIIVLFLFPENIWRWIWVFVFLTSITRFQKKISANTWPNVKRWAQNWPEKQEKCYKYLAVIQLTFVLNLFFFYTAFRLKYIMKNISIQQSLTVIVLSYRLSILDHVLVYKLYLWCATIT